jgi:hypothetical protein
VPALSSARTIPAPRTAPQELGGRQPRIEDQRDLGILRRARQQRADGRGLAGADLAGQLDEAAGLVDAVQQMRERIRVPALR